MNLARWSIDYVQKKSKAEVSQRAKSITDSSVVQDQTKTTKNSKTGTPDNVKRILAADEAQLDLLTEQRN